MEVSFVKESNYRREPVLISQSSPSVIEPRLIEHAADDGVQGTETCDHFSMRGYVAEFRNKDLKICWPFSMFHDQTSDKHISLLPPLLAAKYKWWDCQNCLHKTNNCATTRANEAPNIRNVEAKIGTIVLGNTFITNDQELLLSFHQLSEEKFAGGLMEAGHSVNVTNDKCCPSANCGKDKNNYKITGLQAAKASQFSCRGIQNLSTNKPDYIATKGEACHMGGRAERDVVSTVNTFEALYSEDMVNAEPKETQVVNESTDIRGVAGPAFIDSVLCGKRDKQLVREMGKAKEQFKEATRETEVPLGNNIGIPEVDYQTAVAAHLSELDFRGLDESNNETSDNNVASPQNAVQIQNGTKRLVISDGNLQQKKARKVRLLDDIMRSEEFYSSGKVHISDGNEEVNQIKNKIDRRPHLSRWKDQHFGPEIHHTSQETKVKSFKGKRRYIENIDDRSSLMFWLKKAREKVVTNKRYTETKHMDAAADESAEYNLGHSLKVSGAKEHKQNAIVHRMLNAMHQGYLMPKQGKKTREDIVIVDGKTTKQMDIKIIYSKSK